MDGATKGSLKCNQKLVVQTLKNIVVNNVLAWRMLERVDVLESAQTFQTPNCYRPILNKVQSFGYFVLDVSIKLIHHASRLSNNDEQIEDKDEAVKPSTEEEGRLLAIAKSKQRNRVAFLNSADGVKLRLVFQPHTQKDTKTKRNHVICGCGTERRRSNYKCSTCDDHLCVRELKSKRRSFWAEWHEYKRLEDVASVKRPEQI